MNRAMEWLALCLAILLIAISITPGTMGQDTLSNAEQVELAEMFAPIIYLHPDDDFYPISPHYAIAKSELKQVGVGLISSNPTEAQLAQLADPNAGYYLDYRMGTIYDDGIREDFLDNVDDYPPTIHARVTTQNYDGNDVYAIQYYMYYAFNKGPHNTHEGDWEMVMVVCDMSREPLFAAYSQHYAGEFAIWDLVETHDTDMNPKVYVALGSHANYFREYEGKIGPAADVCSASGMVLTSDEYDIVLLDGQGWLLFAGRWGDYGNAMAGIKGERGPPGPVYQSERWNRPIIWAEGLKEVSEGWFTLNWTVANILWIILGIMAIALIVTIFGVHRRKKKQRTLGPRWTPFLYIKGMDMRSIATILAIVALLIGITGYFMPWYSISIDIEAGAYSTPGAVDILNMDGLHGLSFTRPEPGWGLVHLHG